MLYCMGCHGDTAHGVPGKVPALAGVLPLYMRTSEGRNYVLRVPGAANSVLSDAQLAARAQLAGGDLSGCRPESSPTVHRRRGHECPSRPAGQRAGHASRGRRGTGEHWPCAGAGVLILCELMPRVLLMLDLCRRSLLGALLSVAALAAARAAAPTPADLVVRNAKIYTVDKAALDRAGTCGQGRPRGVRRLRRRRQAWVGPNTRIEDLGGRLVLPGLIDAHIHPLDIADLDVCDLDDHEVTLKQLSRFVAECLAHYKTPPGGSLRVLPVELQRRQSAGCAAPDAARGAGCGVHDPQRSSCWARMAITAPSTASRWRRPRTPPARSWGCPRQRWPVILPRHKALIGVDENGEPNGAVNEDARAAVSQDSMLYLALDEVVKVAERVPAALSSVGITGVLDAFAAPEGQAVYDKLLADGQADRARGAGAVLRSVRRPAGPMARSTTSICSPRRMPSAPSTPPQCADPRRRGQDLRRRR